MRRIFYILLALTLLSACAPQPQQVTAAATSQATAASTTPKPTETATPIPLVEILPGVMAEVNGFNAITKDGTRYTSGVDGKYIKMPAGAEVPNASALDKSSFEKNTGVSFENRNKLITGVERLTIDENGIATLDVDGNGKTETFSIRNMKVQEGKLMVAGYVWNEGKWEVFNPGFPMGKEDPDRLGWFNKEDFANGNYLRFYQRALEKLAEGPKTKEEIARGFTEGMTVEQYEAKLFEGVLPFESWGVHKRSISGFEVVEGINNNEAIISNILFKSDELKKITLINNGHNLIKRTTKDMLPYRNIPIFGLLKFGGSGNSDCVVFGQELLNNNIDGSGAPNTRTVFSIANKKMIWGNGYDQNYIEEFKGAFDQATGNWNIFNPYYLNKGFIILPITYSQGGKVYPFVTADVAAYINKNGNATKDGSLSLDISLYFFGADTISYDTYFLKLWVSPANNDLIEEW